MPVSNANNPCPTLAELIELRRAIPALPENSSKPGSLMERFLIPPFSVLDARQGYWQKRKRAWLELGIQSELGRGENVMEDGNGLASPGMSNQYRKNGLLGFSEQARSHYKANATPGGSLLPSAQLGKDGRTQRGDGKGRPMAKTYGSGGPGTMDEQRRQWRETASLQSGLTHGTTIHPYDGSSSPNTQSGTSIFDPVICELAYRWFCPPYGWVLDPFAGGSVRGIVAAKTGRAYVGIDLRPEQAEANETQRRAICPDADLKWVVGDAMDVTSLCPGQYDLVFSCPPYADLERYSDDPRDLSTMEYKDFLKAYQKVVADSCAMLKQNRFAVFVVGDVRDRKTGLYRRFPGDTIEAFRNAGLELYNQAVLLTCIGSLPIRVGKQFAGYRKLGNTHQYVLVFVKGDPARAAQACGDVDVDDLEIPEPIPGRILMCQKDAQGTLAHTCFADTEVDTFMIGMSDAEAYLMADISRGQARLNGKPVPRTWIGTRDSWQRLQDGEELTYIIGGVPYLNKAIFPNATGPVDMPPVPKALW